MTTRSHRRTAPVLIGLGTGAVVAVVAAVLGPARPATPAPVTAPAGNTAQAAPRDTPSMLALDAPPETPTPAPPAPRPGPPAAPGAKPNPLLPGAGPRPPGPTAVNPLNRPPADKPANEPVAGGPAAPGANRVVAVPVVLPGLPPYLPALLPKLPGPPKQVLPKKPDLLPKKPAVPGLSGPAAAVVALTNAERAKAGCKPLQVDPKLNKSALGHSSDMSRRDYFEHESPEGEDFADREAEAGFRGNSGGENIAKGQKSAAEVMDDWMHSPGHKRNILDCKFTKIGVGYVPSGHYWTQNFGG